MSTKFSLNLNDIWQSVKSGLFTAFIPPFLAMLAPVVNTLNAGQIPFLQVPVALDYHTFVASVGLALSTFIGNSAKRFFSDATGKLFGSATAPIAPPPQPMGTPGTTP